jgi:HAD superfamily hydrolase (TIGR01549 family)
VPTAVIFDLDDTLIDTSALRAARAARPPEWKAIIKRLDETRLFPGVRELLKGLQARRIPIAIVTTSVSYYADAALRHHGINYHARVAYHDATPKPAPDSILLALKKLNVSARETIGVGDAEKDRLAYQAAGVLAIGAAWSPIFQIGPWGGIAQAPAEVLSFLP